MDGSPIVETKEHAYIRDEGHDAFSYGAGLFCFIRRADRKNF